MRLRVSDKHDVKTVGQLRASRIITTGLQVGHRPKRGTGSELLWLADFVMGSYTDAYLHDAPECWKILTAAHMVEVHDL